MPNDKQSERNNQIDALRGLAALAVVLYHYTFWFGYGELAGSLKLVGLQTEPSLIFKWGSLGVPLFFMISGCVMVASSRRTESSIAFFRNRFARLYPAFLLSVVSSFLIYSACNHHIEAASPIPITQFLSNTTMSASLFGDYYINGAHWTLETELQFYLIVGVMITIQKQKWLPSLLLLIVIANLVLSVSDGWEQIPGMWRVQQKFHFMKFASYFLLGATAAETNPPKLYSVVCLMCAFVDLALNNSYPFFPCILLFFVFWLSCKGHLRFLDNKYLVFLGTISYALYLFHGPCGYPIITFMQKTAAIDSLVILSTALSIAISAFICFYIELPLYRAVRKRSGIN